MPACSTMREPLLDQPISNTDNHSYSRYSCVRTVYICKNALSTVAHTSWFGIELSYLYGTLLDGIVRQTRCSHRARDILHDALVRYATAASASHIETPQIGRAHV